VNWQHSQCFRSYGANATDMNPQRPKAIVTYTELARCLKKHRFKETEASITNKLKRGTFAATWFLACLAALELPGVALEDV
jgi:hypothetical protein